MGRGRRGGAAVRRRLVRRRHLVARRDLRARSRGGGRRAAPRLPAGRDDRDDQLHARGPGRRVLRARRPLRAAAAAGRAAAARCGATRSTCASCSAPRRVARADREQLRRAQRRRPARVLRPLQGHVRAARRPLRRASPTSPPARGARPRLPRVRDRARRRPARRARRSTPTSTCWSSRGSEEDEERPVEHAAIDGIDLAYGLRGAGEPVVLDALGRQRGMGGAADRRLSRWARAIASSPMTAPASARSGRAPGPLSLADHAAHCHGPDAAAGHRPGPRRGALLERGDRAPARGRRAGRGADARAPWKPARPPKESETQAAFLREVVGPAVAAFPRGRCGRRRRRVVPRGVFGPGYRAGLDPRAPGFVRAGRRGRGRVLRAGAARSSRRGRSPRRRPASSPNRR